MTKEQIKQQIEELESSLSEMNEEESKLVKQGIADLEAKLKDAEKKEAEDKAVKEKEAKKEKTAKEEEAKKEKKPETALKDVEFTPEDIKAFKKFFKVLKTKTFKTIKNTEGVRKKVTKVKPHSTPYLHAKRIVENMPKVFKPSIVELSKGKGKVENKSLISKTEKLINLMTVFANDIDLMILTRDEQYVDGVIEFLVKVLTETHESNESFKYDGRAKVKAILSKIPELKKVKFADGGTI